MNISTDKFISIGCKNKDLEAGTDVVEADKLCIGLPVVLLQANGENPKQISLNTAKEYNNGYNNYYSNKTPVVLNGSDFQTKSIIF